MEDSVELRKLRLIDEIKSSELKGLTTKQLSSILKIIKEYQSTTIQLDKEQEHEIAQRFITYYDKYKEYVEDTGFVECGIEYEFLHYIGRIINRK